MGVPSDGSYGIPEGVIFGYPVTCKGGQYQVVQGLQVSEFGRARIDATLKELHEERDGVKHLLGRGPRTDEVLPSAPVDAVLAGQQPALPGEGRRRSRPTAWRWISRRRSFPRRRKLRGPTSCKALEDLRLRPARGDRARQPARLAVDRRRPPRGRAQRRARHPVSADREPAGSRRQHRGARPRRRRQPAGDDDDRDAVRRAALGGDRRRLGPHRLPGDGDRAT